METIKKLGVEYEKDTTLRINKKQEEELLDIFHEVLYGGQEPQNKYGTAIILQNDGSFSINNVDHRMFEPIVGYKIEDYEKVFKILRNK